MHYCEFCGYSNCKSCSAKTRLFLQTEEEAKETARGKICKLCDRKFFIKKLLEKTLVLIDTYKITIQNLAVQAKARETDLKKCVADFEKSTKNSRYLLEEVKEDAKKSEEIC